MIIIHDDTERREIDASADVPHRVDIAPAAIPQALMEFAESADFDLGERLCPIDDTECEACT